MTGVRRSLAIAKIEAARLGRRKSHAAEPDSAELRRAQEAPRAATELLVMSKSMCPRARPWPLSIDRDAARHGCACSSES